MVVVVVVVVVFMLVVSLTCAAQKYSHSSSSSSGEVDSKELYRAVAGILPGDFEVRVHTSEVIVQVASRAEDLLEAGKVALEALGETKAAADMQGDAAAADSVDLEVGLFDSRLRVARVSLWLSFNHSVQCTCVLGVAGRELGVLSCRRRCTAVNFFLHGIHVFAVKVF